MVMAMVATFPSRIESAQFNVKDDTVVLINPSMPQEQADILRLSKAQLRDRLVQVQNQLQKAEETIHLLHGQMQPLSKGKPIDNIQGTQPKVPEPRRQSSTYVVPGRHRSQRFDRATRSVPFYLLMSFLGVGLVTAIALVMPMTSVQLGLFHWLTVALKGIFIAIAIGTVISLSLEVSKYHAH